jgi:hypothetical protein
MKRAGMRLWRRLALAAAGAGALAAAGCEDDTKYSYVRVTVSLNDQVTPYYLGRISSCGANVMGADDDFGPLYCPPGGVTGRQLGAFEWSTLQTSGTVTFVVTLKDPAGMDIGRGESAPVTLVPDTKDPLPAQVVVIPDPKALQPPN